MNASDIISIGAALVAAGALIVSILSLSRSPRVLWVTEDDWIELDDDPRDGPYLWSIRLVNRGRAPATAVRTRYIFADGTETAWNEKGTIDQGDEMLLTGSMNAKALAGIKSAAPRLAGSVRQGPAYDVEWRGASERRRPQVRTYFPTRSVTKITD